MRQAIIFLFCLVISTYGKPNILLIGSATETYITSVVDVLSNTNRFQAVDYVDGYITNPPSLDNCLQYDAILVWTDYPFLDPVGYGILLTSYIESGRGVVSMVAENSNGYEPLGGDWYKYKIFLDSWLNFKRNPTYTINDPSHPLANGVTTDTFKGSSNSLYSSVNAGQLAEGSKVVATYADGNIFVAYKDNFGPNKAKKVDLCK